jgi:transposase-like protein
MNSNKTQGGWQEMLTTQEGNFLARMVQEALQAALNEQFEKELQAKLYERTEQRKGYRNGSYERHFKTRVGTIYLNICRDREGNFHHNLFEKYQRGEKALVLGISEMYFNGVSTRKVSAIMEQLCGFSISKSQVSELTATFDSTLKEWVNRPLEKPYPYLIVDARYEKIRENNHVASKAFVVVVGITDEGIREIIGTYVINSESYESWDECFNSLKARGLHGVTYSVSDENKGLRKALMKYFQGAKLQRCQVHFMRNFIGKLSKSNQAQGIELLQDVFAAPTVEEAKTRLEKVSQFLLSKKKPDVVEWLEESIDDTLAVLALPKAHRKKMKSTNMLERLNQELKRRSRVVRIFPNDASCLRLLGTICQETSESWDNRKYLNRDEE